MRKLQLQNQRVLVMGLGRFGGGVGATRFAVTQGASVRVTDMLPRNELTDSLAAIADLDVQLCLGQHRASDFADADLIVVNPAVQPDNPLLDIARHAGARLTTEIELLLDRLPDLDRVIGVTGSAGKSTVTAMIGHILEHAGERTCVGGNLGGSLLASLDTITPDHWIILELSSFMLHYLRNKQWSPHIAVITSFAPNHLDWHGSLQAYRNAKHVILDHQHTKDLSIGTTEPDSALACRTYVGQGAPIDLLVPGKHNQRNARLATTVTQQLLGNNAAHLLRDFAGLEHRLQRVADRDGVLCYNDSKSTTPDAARLAIDAFEPGTVHLICGGYDKGCDLTPLARYAASHCAGLYTLGATGDRIARAAGDRAIRCKTLDRAVAAALHAARPGHVIVLSPACASWDQFTHYADRGNAFVRLVRKDSTSSPT